MRARPLDKTLHAMISYSPGEDTWEEARRELMSREKPMPLVRVDAPAERAERKRKPQGAPKSEPKSELEQRPYDADEAAKLLAERFGDRVRRAKR